MYQKIDLDKNICGSDRGVYHNVTSQGRQLATWVWSDAIIIIKDAQTHSCCMCIVHVYIDKHAELYPLLNNSKDILRNYDPTNLVFADAKFFSDVPHAWLSFVTMNQLHFVFKRDWGCCFATSCCWVASKSNGTRYNYPPLDYPLLYQYHIMHDAESLIEKKKRSSKVHFPLVEKWQVELDYYQRALLSTVVATRSNCR